MTDRKKHGRKLLIASIGVAAVSYVACGGDTNDTSGDGGTSAGSAGTSNTGGSFGNTGGDLVANLIAPPLPDDAASGGGGDIHDAAAEKAVVGFDVLVGNLVAPPPPDAKDDGK